MAENKWIMDGHHYTCPECGKTIAIVVNESDECFEFCPFCGKRMSGQSKEKNKMEQVAALFGKATKTVEKWRGKCTVWGLRIDQGAE